MAMASGVMPFVVTLNNNLFGYMPCGYGYSPFNTYWYGHPDGDGFGDGATGHYNDITTHEDWQFNLSCTGHSDP